MKYYDVFGESGFHSAFMTTYAFSAQAFEDVPFPKLRGAGCRNIAILADKAMLNMDVPRFDAAPLIAFIAAKETNYGDETDERIPG